MSPRRSLPISIGLALLGAAALAAPPDDSAAAPGGFKPPAPRASIVSIESDDQLDDASSIAGDVVFARTAAPAQGEDDGWWLRLDVAVKNTGGAPITVTSFDVDTDESALEAVDVEDVAINAGATKTIKIPNGFGESGDMPDSLTVKAKVSGWAQKVTRTVDLLEYENPTPSAGYRFPGRGNDLPEGVYWKAGSHAHSLTQRYAYDFGNRRWDTGLDAWTGYTEHAIDHEADPGAENNDHLIWNRPVYAGADATIVRCSGRSVNDLDPGDSAGTGGGNGLILDMGDGTWLAYYHMRKNTIPAALCPTVGNVGDDNTPLNIPVGEGQFLGRVGNTGNSSGPHLHLQLTDHPGGVSSSTARGMPLRFKGISVHEYSGYDPTTDLFSFWNQLSNSESAVPVNVLIDPPCGGPGCAIAPLP